VTRMRFEGDLEVLKVGVGRGHFNRRLREGSAGPREGRRRSKTNLKKIQSEVPTIPVAFSSENETAVFADDFLGALDKSDIKYISLPSYVEPDECGVMVGTKDPSNPSAQTIKIRDALRSSGESAARSISASLCFCL
jgi:hypothetical protein